MYKHWDLQRPRPMEEAAIAMLRDKRAKLFDASTLLRLFKTNEYVGRQRIARLTERGILTRVRSGLYRFNDPAQSKSAAVTRAEVLNACAPGSVLAYETAMAAHGFGSLARPTRMKAFSSDRSKPRALGGGWEIVPIRSSLERNMVSLNVPGFGTTVVASAEETILDGLDHPRRVDGGVLQVARFMGFMRGRLAVSRLVELALSSRGFPMVHRLGLLVEMSGQAKPEHLAQLRANLRDQYRVLDPSAERCPERLRYWMLEVNVPYEELAKALGVPWPPQE